MTLQQFLDFVTIINRPRPTKLRLGQFAFKALYEEFPNIANFISGTKYDPFYDDEKLPNLLKFLIENLED